MSAKEPFSPKLSFKVILQSREETMKFWEPMQGSRCSREAKHPSPRGSASRRSSIFWHQLWIQSGTVLDSPLMCDWHDLITTLGHCPLLSVASFMGKDFFGLITYSPWVLYITLGIQQRLWEWLVLTSLPAQFSWKASKTLPDFKLTLLTHESHSGIRRSSLGVCAERLD